MADLIASVLSNSSCTELKWLCMSWETLESWGMWGDESDNGEAEVGDADAVESVVVVAYVGVEEYGRAGIL
jgi:hypothetical protein